MLVTDGYRALMGEVRASWDPGDQWGTVMEWLFGIATVVYVRTEGATVATDFTPSPLLVARPVVTDDYPDTMVWDMIDDGLCTVDDVLRVYAILSRYADWLRAAGLDY